VSHPNCLTPLDLHERFLSILPRLQLHALIYFRTVRCPDRQADLVAEVLALCWSWFVRLWRRGKDGTEFASALATYAARAVKSGRRLCGQDSARDALSQVAQRKKGFTVSSLPQGSGLAVNVFDEALRDNTRSPVPERVAFRQDFPAWQATLTQRDRRLLEDLMAGERTSDVAGKYGLSFGRVSQLRREFRDDWRRFVGDMPAVDACTSRQVC
jgi:hypothetical protein